VWFFRKRLSQKEFHAALSTAASPVRFSLRDFFASRFNAPRAESSTAAIARLTPREREIALFAAQGYTNKEIADALVIAPDTVKTHVRSILAKLNLHSKAELRLYWANRDWARE